MKSLVVFDLDGTLATSKQAIDREMADLFCALLQILPIAVISGGDWPQFERQLLEHLPSRCGNPDLFLLPTSGTKFYRFDGVWSQVYADNFSSDERLRVMDALGVATAEAGLAAENVWGDQVEDRGSQITFSGLGQEAKPELKALWDADLQKRNKLKSLLAVRLPDFAIRIGGSTSVDITKPGIDKAYGIRKLATISNIGMADMLFVGDALYPGGNDAPVRDAGVATIAIRDIADTKRVIETIIKFSS
ncbi:HAD-IIB family hydrolase [Aquisediminimonas profunda]|uniref:HAD-IIB family hydrolase n=1 Tax=Aquisediminimonas profunda TaxID=1550733 RepID=UPI001C627770|nr:HAD-IIB family hydrolase [Aquisediminimonas profunda]